MNLNYRKTHSTLVKNTAAVILLLLSSNLFAKNTIVSTVAYKEIAIKVTRTIGGDVPAAQDSKISAQISATIIKFYVDTGNAVTKGDLLATLDCRENKLKLKQAAYNLKAIQAQLEYAKTQFDQAKKLNKQGSISKELHNKRKTEESRLKAVAENRTASRSLAQINVDRCQIKAPFDGYITDRLASVGELTKHGTPVLKLVSKANNIVEVKINHQLLNSFSNGSNYKFIFNDNSFTLKVDFILPVLDTATHNHIARLSFTDKIAVTGSVGKVRWQEANTSIPSAYIVTRDKKLGVFIVKNNTAQFIEIDNASEGKTAVLMLDGNTQIIAKGRYSVQHGDTLQVNNQASR